MTAPLVVFHDHTTCNRCGGEATIWTDGIRVFSLTDNYENTNPERDGTSLTVSCSGMYADQVCRGVVRFNLADECWTPNPAAVANLVTYGQELSA